MAYVNCWVGTQDVCTHTACTEAEYAQRAQWRAEAAANMEGDVYADIERDRLLAALDIIGNLEEQYDKLDAMYKTVYSTLMETYDAFQESEAQVAALQALLEMDK